MLTLGKKMLCVYGLKPDQSNGELWCMGETATPESLIGIRKKMTVHVRLFPRESQPSSSTCWWTVSVRARGLFRKNKCCRITEKIGTKTFAATDGRYSVNGEAIEIRGELQDESVDGQYFLLRLKYSGNLERNVPAGVLYEGTLARSTDFDVDGDSWEITHDAMIFRDRLS